MYRQTDRQIPRLSLNRCNAPHWSFEPLAETRRSARSSRITTHQCTNVISAKQDWRSPYLLACYVAASVCSQWMGMKLGDGVGVGWPAMVEEEERRGGEEEEEEEEEER